LFLLLSFPQNNGRKKNLNEYEIKEKFFHSNIRDKENNFLILDSNHKQNIARNRTVNDFINKLTQNSIDFQTKKA
jgi:hypothetical protein